MLNPVVDVPCVADIILDSVLLINEELVALDGPPWHEKNVRVFDVDWVLLKQLLNDHLH